MTRTVLVRFLGGVLLLARPVNAQSRDATTRDTMWRDDALRRSCSAAASQLVLTASPDVLPAAAVWVDGRHLKWPGVSDDARVRLLFSVSGGLSAVPGAPADGVDSALVLSTAGGEIPSALAARLSYVADGATFAVPTADTVRMRAWHRGQLVLVREDAAGRVLQATRVQHAAALDTLYAAADTVPDLGVTVTATRTAFSVWAPTAQRVHVCSYATGVSKAATIVPMRRDAATGVWRAALRGNRTGSYYTYLVDVYVPGVGVVRNRVTDPYSVSLTTDSRRSYVASLNDPALMPPGFAREERPGPTTVPTDQVIYELHVRDFSISDRSVPAPDRGTYRAFTHRTSQGMQHLRDMQRAGVTDVHLLPVFDIATIPEGGCVAAEPRGAPDSRAQQAVATANAASDCFNWGYDPFHYTAPEGSYASDAADGAVRVRELRQLVQSLHGLGLRVGMDVVYNHTTAAGQDSRSVLDRIVPGYYHRLNATGGVETSTCCANTATEHRMMAKLMIESAETWARAYHIDAFRFDLMGHQPRAAMLALQRRVNAAAGRPIALIGEGWNFGEVADGARFVQAAQGRLGGTGIGTFTDRARDAIRGGGPGDNGPAQRMRQGYITGLFYAPNEMATVADARTALFRAADMVRVGLAGTLATYRMQVFTNDTVPLALVPYNGQPAGYADEPGDVVNYVENHDNQTLFDVAVFKLATGTSRADRARVQTLGAALNVFSQGIAYFHAGQEVLRSKSMDRNSFDSGDWFNRLDWTMRTNHFGTGLPPARDNAESWPLMQPLLADTTIAPTPDDIRFANAAFLDLLAIRRSSTLFRLRTAADVAARLTFHNTGSVQEPTVMVGHLNGEGYPGAQFAEVVYLVNVDTRSHDVVVPALAGRPYVLHPVHRATTAADTRAAQSAWNAERGTFRVPARTAVVWVRIAP